MRDLFQWSISLGRWGATTVRLHLFFLIFAAATLYLCWQDTSLHMAGLTTLALTLLLLSALAHEWGHWFVAHRMGTAPDTLVIGPLGGASDWRQTADRRGGLLSVLAGPATNLLICGLILALLGWITTERHFLQLLNPLVPVWSELETPVVQQVLQLAFWINWLLFLVNLMPAYPFDGGHILHTVLRAVRPHWPGARVAAVVFWVAAAFAAMVFMTGLIMLKREGDVLFPMSFVLFLLSALILVSAHRDIMGLPVAPSPDQLNQLQITVATVARRRQPRVDTGDEQAGAAAEWRVGASDEEAELATPWDDEPVSATDEHADEYADDHNADDHNTEEDEDDQVDLILSQLHAGGMESLTSEQRAVLQRASDRLRARRR